ncbi:MAG: PaREP1 family protein [Halobacteria archaeon]
MARETQATYLRLNGKYLTDAEKLLAEGDYPQASEKFWGACAEAIKAVAARKGKRLGSHRSLAEFIETLDADHPEWGLPRLFNAANSLHANFYEDWLTPKVVEDGAEAVREMVTRLKRLL